MDDNRDDFFNSIFRPKDGFEKQLMYENRVVKRVITECGIKPRSWGKLVNICRDETGHPFFSFNWFNNFFRQFPARLSGKRIGYCGTKADDNGVRKKIGLYELNLADIMRPDKNLLVRAIANALGDSDVDIERPFVFVFPIVRKTFCAHNMSADNGDMASRAQWIFRHERNTMTVEPTNFLFQAIGGDWYQD
jgi:hypothetical protein